MQPWKISLGMTAIIMALALMLAGERFAYLQPHFWIIVTDYWIPVAVAWRTRPGHAYGSDLRRCPRFRVG